MKNVQHRDCCTHKVKSIRYAIRKKARLQTAKSYDRSHRVIATAKCNGEHCCTIFCIVGLPVLLIHSSCSDKDGTPVIGHIVQSSAMVTTQNRSLHTYRDCVDGICITVKIAIVISSTTIATR